MKSQRFKLEVTGSMVDAASDVLPHIKESFLRDALEAAMNACEFYVEVGAVNDSIPVDGLVGPSPGSVKLPGERCSDNVAGMTAEPKRWGDGAAWSDGTSPSYDGLHRYEP